MILTVSGTASVSHLLTVYGMNTLCLHKVACDGAGWSATVR